MHFFEALLTMDVTDAPGQSVELVRDEHLFVLTRLTRVLYGLRLKELIERVLNR